MERQEVLDAIAANVRRLRRERGLSQEALAEAVQVDIRTIQRVEAAETNLTIGLLVDLSRELEVEAPALLEPGVLKHRKRGRPKGS